MSMTQHELVKELNISRGTLHRVLSGSPLVKASTRERVLEELGRINYVPNAIARGLKMRRTHTIGVVGPAAIRLANIDKLNALHLAAQGRGYSVLLGFSDGTPGEDAVAIRDLKSRMVDGFISIGRGLPEGTPNLQRLVDEGTPLVTLYPIPGLETDCVFVDTQKAFFELTMHLIKLGHTKIGLLLDSSSSQYSLNRELGFRDAMIQEKLPIREDWVVHVTPDGTTSKRVDQKESLLWQVSDYQFGFWGTSLLLARRDRPTALICFSDDYAVGALRAADLAGVAVPEELALVGYDGKESARFARVPLTTMHQPDEQVGKTAVELLLKRIESKNAGAPVQCPHFAELVVRESCGAETAKAAALAPR